MGLTGEDMSMKLGTGVFFFFGEGKKRWGLTQADMSMVQAFFPSMGERRKSANRSTSHGSGSVFKGETTFM